MVCGTSQLEGWFPARERAMWIRLKVLLNLAEITDGKRIEDKKGLFISVVGLVPGVTRNEEHSSGLNAEHHFVNGDSSAA